MPQSKRQNERLIGILIVGSVALNYPILSLFSKGRLFFGIPLLYLYLFLFWGAFIACLAFILEKPQYQQLKTSSMKQEKSG